VIDFLIDFCTALYILFIEVEAVVMHDYSAQQDDELTLKVGDVIHSIVKSGGGWWEGVLRGRKGVFPDNFVKVTSSLHRNQTIYVL